MGHQQQGFIDQLEEAGNKAKELLVKIRNEQRVLKTLIREAKEKQEELKDAVQSLCQAELRRIVDEYIVASTEAQQRALATATDQVIAGFDRFINVLTTGNEQGKPKDEIALQMKQYIRREDA